jgi:hypothetical protein
MKKRTPQLIPSRPIDIFFFFYLSESVDGGGGEMAGTGKGPTRNPTLLLEKIYNNS